MKQYDILYHASTSSGLTSIQPKRTMSKDIYIGDYIFATPSQAMASMYLVPRQAGTILIEAFSGEPYAVINNNFATFQKVDSGGSIYVLPGTSFIQSPQPELVDTELVATSTVIPIQEDVYKTSLEAMRKFGVKIFFIEGELFEKVQTAKDHGLSILSTLPSY